MIQYEAYSMVKNKIIFVVKESRAGEQRVSLIPEDVKILVEQHFTVMVEHDAGAASGHADEAYVAAGATIRHLDKHAANPYHALFLGCDIIVRAKRPDRAREQLENQAIAKGTIMFGALDLLDQNAPHIKEYQRAGIVAYSLDQLELAADDPMNILSAMSHITGRLALLDAIEKCPRSVHKVVLIGFGTAGKSALQTAVRQRLDTSVVVRGEQYSEMIEAAGGKALCLNPNATLAEQQASIRDWIQDADIVIASARRAKEVAPMLIPNETLSVMQPGAVIVDLALTEGGNVQGSEHDQTHVLGNDVIVTNVSGYPKSHPEAASKLWSQASRLFIFYLAKRSML